MPWGMQDDFTAPGQWTLLEEKKRPRKIVVHGPKKLAKTILHQLNAIPAVKRELRGIADCLERDHCGLCKHRAEETLDYLDE